MNIGIQEHGFALRREVQRNGVQIPDAERHCKVYVLSDGRRCAGHSGETGEGFAERMDESPRTKSEYSVPVFGLAFPSGIYVSA